MENAYEAVEVEVEVEGLGRAEKGWEEEVVEGFCWVDGNRGEGRAVMYW